MAVVAEGSAGQLPSHSTDFFFGLDAATTTHASTTDSKLTYTLAGDSSPVIPLGARPPPHERLAESKGRTVESACPGLNLREQPPRGSFGSIRPPRVHAGAGGTRAGGQGQASQYS